MHKNLIFVLPRVRHFYPHSISDTFNVLFCDHSRFLVYMFHICLHTMRQLFYIDFTSQTFCAMQLRPAKTHTFVCPPQDFYMSPQLAIKAFVLIIKYRGCQLEYTNFIYWIVKCMYKRCLHQCDLKKYNEQYLDIFVNVHFWLLFKRVKHRNSVK